MKQRVLLKGNDAIDLLHRISTLDFKRMPINQNRIGLILNPKGNIVAYFDAVKSSNDSVELSYDDQTLEILDQYTFAENYEITKLEPKVARETNEEARILSLTPAYGKEFKSDGSANPLEIHLKSAIDDQKGCYPGQEVIEKIISLGSPAKRLCVVRSSDTWSGPFTTPQKITLQSQEVGVLTSFIKTADGKGLGLAILRKTAAVTGKIVMIGDCSLQIERVSE